MGGLFPNLRHHIKQEANYHIQQECGDCCGLPCDLYKDYKDDHLL